jgi:subtilisin family serine protease
MSYRQTPSPVLPVLLLIISILLFCVNLNSAYNGGVIPSRTEKYPKGQIIVGYSKAASLEQKRNIEKEYNLRTKRGCEKGGWVSYFTDRKANIEKMSEEIKDNQYVIYAQPNYYFRVIWQPNDPYYQFYQWHLQRISMENAWDIEMGGDSTIIVGVLDTGVAFENYPVPSYEQNKIDSNTTMYMKLSDYNQAHFTEGFDFVNNDGHPNDNHSHGSHVASTIVESTNNGQAVSGIAFNVTVMPVKVIDWAGLGTADIFAMGVYYAVDNNADILNFSLATSSNPGQVVSDAIDYATENGVIMVAGAGNSGSGSVSYPAKYEDVIAVSATCSSIPDSLAYYSNFGSGIDVAAPGGDLVDRDNNGFPDLIVQQTILPGIFNNGFAKPDSFVLVGYGGSSMATPHVTATSALMLSHGIPPENIREILHQTSVDFGEPGYDTLFGYGRIDCFRALGGEDTVPPQISETTILEDTYFTGPFAVWSKINDLFGIGDARLYYKVNSLEWKDSVYVDKIYPQKYLFYIPEVTPPAVIKYYIEATDIPGNIATDPDGAPVYYYSFIVLESGVEAEEDKETPFYIKIPTIVKGDILPIEISRPSANYCIASVYDKSGRLVKQKLIEKFSVDNVKLNIELLGSGIYFLRMESVALKEPILRKFIKLE